MLQCDQIPHLKVYRMKTYLPYMERTPLKDSVIIYNGKTISNVNSNNSGVSTVTVAPIGLSSSM